MAPDTIEASAQPQRLWHGGPPLLVHQRCISTLCGDRAAGRLLKLKIAEGKAAAHHALELGAAVPHLEVHWHLLLAPSCPVELRTLLVEARATGPRRYAEAHGRATDALRDRTGSGV